MKPQWLAVFLYAAVVFGQSGTSISGDITEITFTVSGSPYIVEQDVLVPAGETVVIPQGCVLLFRSFTGMQVKGRLVVDGKQDKPVVFTSVHDGEFNPESAQLPNPFDWNGIFIAQESDGTFLNNFHLRFSVYGVKSQSQNVIIQNGVFRQNGQFHFTVNDEIQYVQDNIPFSYGDEEELDMPPGLESAKPGADLVSKEPSAKKQGGPEARKKKIFRYSTLGIGIAGTGVAVFTGIRTVQNHQKLQDMREGAVSGTDSLFQETEQAFQGNRVAATLTGILAALGYVGFGVTFFF